MTSISIDDPPPPGGEPHAKSAASLKLTLRLRNYFFAGILITAPISITIYLAWIFIQFVDSYVTPLIPDAYNPATYLPIGIPGLGLLIVVAVLTLIGALTAGFAGRAVIRVNETLLARMPVIRSLYSAVKQIFEAVLARQSQAFRETVLIEYPRPGLWTIGFITGRTQGEVRRLLGEETVQVFVPTTPNPTSGFLLFVPKKDVRPLAMGVDEAIKMVVSVGIVVPPDRRMMDGTKAP